VPGHELVGERGLADTGRPGQQDRGRSVVEHGGGAAPQLLVLVTPTDQRSLCRRHPITVGKPVPTPLV
jgi:hypothetical protein